MSMTDNNGEKALKAGIWYTFANYLSKGAVYLTTPIFAILMSKTDIGKYNNINAWIQVLLPIFSLEMASALTLARFDYKEEFNKFVSSTLVFGSVIAGLFGCVLIAFSSFFCNLFNLEKYMLYIVIIYCVLFPAIQFYQSIALFKYEHKKVAILTIVNLLVPLGLSLLLTFLSADQVMGRTIGFYGTTILVCIPVYCFLFFKGRTVSLKYIPYAVKISFPLIFHSLAIHLLATGDRIVITKTLGDESNAMYTMAYTVCGVVSVLWSSMNSAWSPWCTERMNQNDSESIKTKSKPYVLFFAGIMVLVILIAPEILWVMGGGRNYYDARFVIPPILVGLVAQFVYSLYVNVEFYFKMQKRIAIGTIIAAAINVLLNIVFVPRFGYVAASYTTLIGYLVLYFYHYLSLKWSRNDHWYDNRFNLFVVMSFVVCVPLFHYLYYHFIIRYVVLLIVLVALSFVLYKNRVRIIGLWHSLR